VLPMGSAHVILASRREIMGRHVPSVHQGFSRLQLVIAKVRPNIKRTIYIFSTLTPFSQFVKLDVRLVRMAQVLARRVSLASRGMLMTPRNAILPHKRPATASSVPVAAFQMELRLVRLALLRVRHVLDQRRPIASSALLDCSRSMGLVSQRMQTVFVKGQI
jgi:hypothetical protein